MLISSFLLVTSVLALVRAGAQTEQRLGLKRFRRCHEFGHLFCVGGGNWIDFGSCSNAPQKQAGFEFAEGCGTDSSKNYRRLEARSRDHQERSSVRSQGQKPQSSCRG